MNPITDLRIAPASTKEADSATTTTGNHQIDHFNKLLEDGFEVEMVNGRIYHRGEELPEGMTLLRIVL